MANKKWFWLGLVMTVLLFVLFSSCVSMVGRPVSPERTRETRILGTVTTQWISYQFLNIRPNDLKLETKAVSRLMAEARRQGFEGNIDIRNIRVEGNFNPLTLIQIVPLFAVLGNFQTILATGEVIGNVEGGAGPDIQINIY